jgi:CheY-like chemotaxis protein
MKKKEICLGIFDNNVSNRELIKIISKRNYGSVKFFEADNGNNAINIIKQSKIDLCFINIKLPIIDGIDVASFLKQNSPNTIIIGMISFDDIHINEMKQFDKFIKIGLPGFNKLIENQIKIFLQ